MLWVYYQIGGSNPTTVAKHRGFDLKVRTESTDWEKEGICPKKL